MTHSEIRCAMHGAKDPHVDVVYPQKVKRTVEAMSDSYTRGHWLYEARRIIATRV